MSQRPKVCGVVDVRAVRIQGSSRCSGVYGRMRSTPSPPPCSERAAK
jgi:hypothetical protein